MLFPVIEGVYSIAVNALRRDRVTGHGHYQVSEAHGKVRALERRVEVPWLLIRDLILIFMSVESIAFRE